MEDLKTKRLTTRKTAVQALQGALAQCKYAVVSMRGIRFAFSV